MKILFQGDSITDCGRDRSDSHNLAGYSAIVAKKLGDKHEYLNLGLSGNTSTDLLDRYERDIKAIAPDVLTLLIGINDVWRRFDSNSFISAEKFRQNLTQIVARYKQDVKGGKIVIMEPFLIPAADKMHWRTTLIEVIDVVRDVAVKYADGFIALDGVFAKAAMEYEYSELSGDGVHPSQKGHELIADELFAELKKIIG